MNDVNFIPPENVYRGFKIVAVLVFFIVNFEQIQHNI